MMNDMQPFYFSHQIYKKKIGEVGSSSMFYEEGNL